MLGLLRIEASRQLILHQPLLSAQIRATLQAEHYYTVTWLVTIQDLIYLASEDKNVIIPLLTNKSETVQAADQTTF